MKTKCSLLSVSGALLAAFTLNVLAAGPLTPPGSPGDGSNGGPSLTEVKAAIDALAANSNSGLNGRTPIPAQSATYTISAPGNYVLTGNISVTSSNGININATNVTLDLNGFTITSTAAASTGAGITISTNSHGITVRNGSIRSDVGGAGFLYGISLNHGEPSLGINPTCDEVILEDLKVVVASTSSGFAIARYNSGAESAPHAVVVRRVIASCGGRGFAFPYFNGVNTSSFGKVIDCDVSFGNAAAYGIDASFVGQCHVTGPGTHVSAFTAFNND